MAQKYRAADSALNSATASIQALRDAISKKSEVVSLQGEQLLNYRILVDNLKATITNDRELAMIDRADLKRKVKNKNRTILGLSGLSAVLLAIILL